MNTEQEEHRMLEIAKHACAEIGVSLTVVSCETTEECNLSLGIRYDLGRGVKLWYLTAAVILSVSYGLFIGQMISKFLENNVHNFWTVYLLVSAIVFSVYAKHASKKKLRTIEEVHFEITAALAKEGYIVKTRPGGITIYAADVLD